MFFMAAIHKDSDSDYGVTIPDLPGCFSASSSVESAVGEAKEAIECHIEGLLQDGESLPKVRPVEEHKSNPEFADVYCWVMIDVDLSKLGGKAKRVNITLPERILSKIDAFTSNRSRFLTDAALEYMANHLPVSNKSPMSDSQK